jgi:hypothetical protein
MRPNVVKLRELTCNCKRINQGTTGASKQACGWPLLPRHTVKIYDNLLCYGGLMCALFGFLGGTQLREPRAFSVRALNHRAKALSV